MNNLTSDTLIFCTAFIFVWLILYNKGNKAINNLDKEINRLENEIKKSKNR